MKRILFLISTLEGGGAEKSLVELLKGFDYSKYKVTLCLLFKSGVYIDDVPESVRLVYVTDGTDTKKFNKAVSRFRKHNRTFWLRFLFRKTVGLGKFDAVISFMEGFPLLCHNAILNFGKRNYTWVHCDLYNYHESLGLYKSIEQERECYSSMDKIVFVSNFALANFKKLHDIDVPMTCIYNALDFSEITPYQVQVSPLHDENSKGENSLVARACFNIISVGSLLKVKGFDILLKAVRLLTDSGADVSLKILGQGPEEDSLKALRDSLGLAETVEFLGFHKPAYRFIACADLLVSASRTEGLSYVICEAMALGVPVVSTKTAGATELLEDGKYGVLTDFDEESLFLGIKSVIDNRSGLRAFSDSGKKRAGMFDTSVIVAQVCHLLETDIS